MGPHPFTDFKECQKAAAREIRPEKPRRKMAPQPKLQLAGTMT